MSEVFVISSAIHGRGVFAARDFQAGETAHRLDDTRTVDGIRPLRPEAGESEVHCDYLAEGRVVLMPEPERYINHCCDPNTYIRTLGGVRHVLARRPIGAGEEITCDYLVNCHGGDLWVCHCKSGRCRGTIASSFFDLPLPILEEYLPLLDGWFVAEHRERIAEVAGRDA